MVTIWWYKHQGLNCEELCDSSVCSSSVITCLSFQFRQEIPMILAHSENFLCTLFLKYTLPVTEEFVISVFGKLANSEQPKVVPGTNMIEEVSTLRSEQTAGDLGSWAVLYNANCYFSPVAEEKLIADDLIVQAREATDEDLLVVHTRRYLNKLKVLYLFMCFCSKLSRVSKAVDVLF